MLMRNENEQCTGCAFLNERQYSTDGFDVCFDCKCTHNKVGGGRVIDGCRDWHEKLPVPKWCPLLVRTPPVNVLPVTPGNYKIIQDEQAFLQFIDWLPELKEGELFYGCLFARKKYDNTGLLNSDKSQLKRFTSSKDYLYQKVKKLECAVGSYQFNGQPIPQETLALYIMPNPRSLIKAARKTLIELAVFIAGESTKDKNPYKCALKNIQKHASRKVYMDFDFDIDNPFKVQETIKKINGILNTGSYNVVHTRGGFHLLVEVANVSKDISKTWYNAITSLADVDVRGDNLIPVPGCCQGGFVPKFAE